MAHPLKNEPLLESAPLQVRSLLMLKEDLRQCQVWRERLLKQRIALDADLRDSQELFALLTSAVREAERRGYRNGETDELPGGSDSAEFAHAENLGRQSELRTRLNIGSAL